MKITPSVRLIFDLYQQPATSRHTHTFSLALDSRIEGWTVGGRYRGIMRSPLGSEKSEEFCFKHEFSLSVSWDPNQ